MTATTKTPADTGDELAALKADFAQLREDMTALKEGVRTLLQREQTGSEEAAAAKEKPGAEAEAEKTATEEEEWEVLRERLKQTRQHGAQTLDDLGDEVAHRPLASLALAFGVGYVVARLTHLLK